MTISYWALKCGSETISANFTTIFSFHCCSFEKLCPLNGAELIMKYPTVTNLGGVTSQINCLLEMLLESVNSRMMMSLSVLLNCAFEALFLHRHRADWCYTAILSLAWRFQFWRTMVGRMMARWRCSSLWNLWMFWYLAKGALQR